MTEKERREKLRELWLARPEAKRSRNDLLVFYTWLEKNWPELLVAGGGDPYQEMQTTLLGLWND